MSLDSISYAFPYIIYTYTLFLYVEIDLEKLQQLSCTLFHSQNPPLVTFGRVLPHLAVCDTQLSQTFILTFSLYFLMYLPQFGHIFSRSYYHQILTIFSCLVSNSALYKELSSPVLIIINKSHLNQLPLPSQYIQVLDSCALTPADQVLDLLHNLKCLRP